MTNPFPRVFPGEKGDCGESQEDFDRCDAPFEDMSAQEEEGFGLHLDDTDTSEQRWVLSVFFLVEYSGSSIVDKL